MIIDAEFREPAAVGPAIVSLKRYGVGGDQIEVYSGKPLELGPGVLDRPSRMSLIAVLAGICSGSAVTAFMVYTLLDYPLVTGGMPLTSPWATGVVTFEMTMAGAILATALMFLWESGLLRGGGRLPAPKVTASEVVVRFECTEEVAGPVVDWLQRCGAAKVETIEEDK
jgi:hypothetical protein